VRRALITLATMRRSDGCSSSSAVDIAAPSSLWVFPWGAMPCCAGQRRRATLPSSTAMAVAAVCSPIDLAAGGYAIGRGFNRLVYTRMFLNTMVPKALQKLAQFPGLFDGDALKAARDLYEFDNIFTAPLHGFKSTEDYWARASAKPHLHRIRIPALVVNARNDPFVPAWSLPSQADVGQHVTLWQPAHGGHVGFPQGRVPGHVRTMPEAVGSWLSDSLSGGMK